jgi:hypothetical protein
MLNCFVLAHAAHMVAAAKAKIYHDRSRLAERSAVAIGFGSIGAGVS